MTEQKETIEYLIQEFLYWSQNNEMIDTEYLQHGKDLLTAVSIFENLLKPKEHENQRNRAS